MRRLVVGLVVFGGLAWQRSAPDAFTFRHAMRQTEGPPKVEAVAFRKKAL